MTKQASLLQRQTTAIHRLSVCIKMVSQDSP